MTYYEKYNSIVLFSTFIIISIILFVVFFKKNSSIIDPLVLHLVSIASIISLMFGYVFKYEFDENVLIFLSVYIIYVPSLLFFLKNKSNHRHNGDNTNKDKSKLLKLYFISIVLVIFSRYDFLTYALQSTPLEWFFYRFKLIENRNPLQYICRIGGTPFFYYYSYTLIYEKIGKKSLIISVLAASLIIDIVAGGRSSMINFILSYGTYLYKFPNYTITSYIKRVNLIGSICVVLSIVLAVFVSSMYNIDSSFEDGVGIILNRVLAAGDGLEMYLINHADRYVSTGIIEYIKSTFGIFVSAIFHIKTQSFGWRLYELDQGYDSANSVGPNFILPLQVVVLSKYLLLPYVIIIAYLTAKLRNFNLKGHSALSYVFCLNAFYLPTDIEYATLIYVSTLALYFVVFLPHILIKFIRPKFNFFF